MDNQLKKKRKKNKINCFMESCNESINPTMSFVGKCKYCEHIYCVHHRLPETHKCINQEECNKKSFEENSKKNSDKIHHKKIDKI